MDQVGIAAAPLDGGLAVSGKLRRGRAWSAIKVPLVAAYLEWRRAAARTPDGVTTLSDRERRLIERAITRSDNEAASRLFWTMANSRATPTEATRRIQAIQKRAGDHHTRVRTQFGTSVWRIEDAARFLRQLGRGCLPHDRDTAYLLDLMRQITPEQRWGILAATNRPAAI